MILERWAGAVSQKRENSGNGELREGVVLLILSLSVLVTSVWLRMPTNYYFSHLSFVVTGAERSLGPGKGTGLLSRGLAFGSTKIQKWPVLDVD